VGAKASDIISDTRRTHAVGVTFLLAWKAREMTKEITEGGCSKTTSTPSIFLHIRIDL